MADERKPLARHDPLRLTGIDSRVRAKIPPDELADTAVRAPVARVIREPRGQEKKTFRAGRTSSLGACWRSPIRVAADVRRLKLFG